MNRIKGCALIILAVFLIAVGTSIAYAKYTIEYTKTAIHLDIDRTKPIGTVSYNVIEEKIESQEEKNDTNTEEQIQENKPKLVEVTINLSEPILEVEGWELSKDKLTLKKVYDTNVKESITIYDLSKNENTVDILIENYSENQ